MLFDSESASLISGKSSVANSMLELPVFPDAAPLTLILGRTPKTPTFS